jgi:uncharacterized membrane protein YkvA (DUF1232 family)
VTPSPDVLLYIGILDSVLLILALLMYRQVRDLLKKYERFNLILAEK